jgi:hypothetical protein
LKDLASANWFCRVGKHDVQAAKVVGSWEEAINSCLRLAWENVGLDASNAMTRRFSRDFPVRYQEWGAIATRVRSATDDLIQRKVRNFVNERKLPEEIVPHIGWDISHLLMESEYADLCKPAFFSVLGFYYVRGHFPCGWEGDFPNGRLVVY